MPWVKKNTTFFLRFAFQAGVWLASCSPILRPGELQQRESLQSGCFWQLHHGRAQVCPWLAEQPPTQPLPSPGEGTFCRYEGFRGSARAIPVPPQPENNNKACPPVSSWGFGPVWRGRPWSCAASKGWREELAPCLAPTADAPNAACPSSGTFEL